MTKQHIRAYAYQRRLLHFVRRHSVAIRVAIAVAAVATGIMTAPQAAYSGSLDYGAALQSGGLQQDYPPTELPASGI